MKNLTIRGKVVDESTGLKDINGFKYRVVRADIANIKNFICYIPIFIEVGEGDCFETEDWVLTRHDEGYNPIELVARINTLTVIAADKYEPIENFRANVKGLFISSDKCRLTTVGPEKKPFIRATIMMKDEYGEQYTVLLTGFNNCATKLANVAKYKKLNAQVCIKRKRYVDGYELCCGKFSEDEE